MHMTWKSAVHFLCACMSFWGLCLAVPGGILVVVFYFFFLSERARTAEQFWRVCYVSSHMILLSHARKITASLGVKRGCEQSLQLAGSHSYLPRLLKMSFPIKVIGILKVPCNVVTYTSCQQAELCWDEPSCSGGLVCVPSSVPGCRSCSGTNVSVDVCPARADGWDWGGRLAAGLSHHPDLMLKQTLFLLC